MRKNRHSDILIKTFKIKVIVLFEFKKYQDIGERIYKRNFNNDLRPNHDLLSKNKLLDILLREFLIIYLNLE